MYKSAPLANAKRGTFVHDQNQTILCRSRAERVSITSEMAITESLLLQKGHFFRSLNGAL